MKTIIMSVSLLMLVSCGKGSPSQKDNSTILSSFKSTDSRVPDLDLRNVKFGEETSAQSVITSETCSGVITGNPASTTVSDHSVLVQGTEKEGTISFGRLDSPYPRVDDSHCRVVATETYSYKVVNGVLSLTNLKYDITTTLMVE